MSRIAKYSVLDGARWRARHEDEGLTLDEIALAENLSGQTVREWAALAGATFRAPPPRRLADGTLAPDDPRHGTTNGYGNLGCRCEPCCAAHTKYHAAGDYQRRHRDRRAGGPCATPNCSRPADRSYVTGYCHRCNIERGLKPPKQKRKGTT